MPAARTRFALAGAFAALAASGAWAQTVIYVNGSLATGAGTGASWADACRGSAALQDALDAAAPIAGAGQTVQLWVAAGTYVPTKRTVGSDPLSVTFTVLSHEEMYGGFGGNETTLGERDPVANVTTLSGVLDSGGSRASHVVSVTDVDATCVLDGVAIGGGRACENVNLSRGGGLLSLGSSLLLRRCRFEGNGSCARGGGAFFSGGSPRIENCTFVNNQTGGVSTGGGAIWSETGVTCVSSLFLSNKAGTGGAINGIATLDHCSFQFNEAEGAGAVSGQIHCTNSTFIRNWAKGYGAIWAAGTVSDCLFDSNTAQTGSGAIGYAVDFSRCVFRGNSAPFDGVGGGKSFTSCTFENNWTSWSPMVNAQILDRCRFMENLGNNSVASVTQRAVNCLFLNNRGSVVLGNAEAINCTIVGARAASDSNAVVSGGRLVNSLIWGTIGGMPPVSGASISFSNIQGWDGSLGGVGNFSADPRLDAEGRLLSPSPCIDAGDSGAVPPGVTLDAFGQARFVDDAGMPNTGPVAPGLAPVDIGAFEFQGVTCYANCDGSAAPPVLNAADFACFLSAYAGRSPYANCDGSSAAPTLNVMDFSCFLRRFAAGCP